MNYPPPDPRTAIRPPTYTHPVINVQTNVHTGFNHGGHLILDVITCGLWIPFHVLFWIISNGAK